MNFQKISGLDVPIIDTPSFTAVRGSTAIEFQILITGKIYDTGLVNKSVSTLPPEDRFKRMEEAISKDPSLQVNDVDEDILLLQLKDFFNKLRRQGALLEPNYVIKNLRVLYVRRQDDGQTWEPIFRVEYLGGRIHNF